MYNFCMINSDYLLRKFELKFLLFKKKSRQTTDVQSKMYSSERRSYDNLIRI